MNRLTTIPTRNRVNNSFNTFNANDTNNSFRLPSDYEVTGDLEPREKPAQLRKNQRSLYAIWNEFEFGVGSEKPAKDYNSRDRGANRYLYSKRKIFGI